MRPLRALIAGIAIGVLLTIVYVQVSGGWYTYFTVPSYECRDALTAAEVVPNQPNPCNYRRPRWRLFS